MIELMKDIYSFKGRILK